MKKTFKAFSNVFFFVLGIIIAAKILNEQRKIAEDNYIKYKEFFDILIKWLIMKQSGDNLADIIYRSGYKSISIYGMSALGRCLYEESLNSRLNVAYIIDRKKELFKMNIPVITVSELSKYDSPDVIIVTAVHYLNDIKNEIHLQGDYKVISIEEVLYGNI